MDLLHFTEAKKIAPIQRCFHTKLRVVLLNSGYSMLRLAKIKLPEGVTKCSLLSCNSVSTRRTNATQDRDHGHKAAIHALSKCMFPFASICTLFELIPNIYYLRLDIPARNQASVGSLQENAVFVREFHSRLQHEMDLCTATSSDSSALGIQFCGSSSILSIRMHVNFFQPNVINYLQNTSIALWLYSCS